MNGVYDLLVMVVAVLAAPTPQDKARIAAPLSGSNCDDVIWANRLTGRRHLPPRHIF